MNYNDLQNFHDTSFYVTNSGSRYHEKKVGSLQKDGTIKLTSVGKEDVYADIQSYRDETDIDVILAKAVNGDFSGVKGDGVFGDFSTMPSSYFEVLNTVIEGKRFFEKLPVDVKAKFDNDFNKWFVGAGDKEWLENMGYLKDTAADLQQEDEKEVKDNAEE